MDQSQMIRHRNIPGLTTSVSLLILAAGVAQANLNNKTEETKSTAISFNNEASAAVLLQKKWGIELLSLYSTAAGHMLDFRYKVLDPGKSASLFKRETKPYLIHQKSGKVLAVPTTAKIGSLRTSNKPKANRNYWMFFRNYHQLVSKGDKVTVVIGEFRIEDIVVQ